MGVPALGLVLAMAQHRAGLIREARKTLAEAVLATEWRVSRFPTEWIRHVLRREAETLILPEIAAFLEGKYLPRDDERLALLGVCQFTNRTVAQARLYADAFAADPQLENREGVRHRLNAARAAAWRAVGTAKTRKISAARSGRAGEAGSRLARTGPRRLGREVENAREADRRLVWLRWPTGEASRTWPGCASEARWRRSRRGTG